MTSTAILIGNAEYDQETPLPCCSEDVAAMRALLEATGRFDHIFPYVNLDADAMREAVRGALPPDGDHDEVLFYFSGHGIHIGAELYVCGTAFDPSRPNETAFPHSEIMDLFRAARPDVLVTVIDACYSGALLVKGDRPLLPVVKDGLRNVLQFSSSLDDQTSLGGERLSAFTRAFLEASVRKTEGVVYYTDIKNTLRDDFIGNDDQTPFFVNQGTGREILVDDARKLAGFRDELANRWRSKADESDENVERDDTGDLTVTAGPVTATQLLMAAEKRMGGPDEAKALIDNLFDGVLKRFNESEFAEFFDAATTEHATFNEPVIRDFMIRVLSRETRPDRLVTAEIKRTKKKASPWEQATMGILATFNQEWTEHFDLELNCTMLRAQLKLTLTPKYKALQQLQLVLSCAPSLNQCYIFEMVTQHPRISWDAFDDEGREIVRRWYTKGWAADVEFLIGNICDALTKAVRDHIDETTKRLEGD
ncbi:caspase family protein [Mesorhizobium sp. B2-5-7]|uniref:caspase family protein n=1 Tax=Mesorhizobium sp. B2-5-7 TaxID=2589923 RepID=UPI0015E3EC3D|nr:caspase family protein [Mesorhizobium sp. B2-5-7]